MYSVGAIGQSEADGHISTEEKRPIPETHEVHVHVCVKYRLNRISMYTYIVMWGNVHILYMYMYVRLYSHVISVHH